MHQQQNDLPGAPGPGLSALPFTVVTQGVLKLFADGIVLVVAALAVANWSARRRLITRSTGPPPHSSDRVIATDMRGRAQHLARLARGRFAFQVAGIYVILGPALALAGYRLTLAGVGAAIFAVATLIRPPGAVRPVSERFKAGILTGRRTVPAVALAGVSLVSACLVPVMALAGLLFWSLRDSGFVIGGGRIDPGLLGQGALVRAVGSIPLPVLSVDCLVIAVAAAITVPVSYIAARRIATLTADELSRRGDEARILYLRNFADDDIRMPTSRLSRNSLVERIAVYRLERFEEVLVRHLSHVAPVMAVDPAGIRKQPIGAARMMLHTDWRDHITEHIEKARLIVVGAAPQRRTGGLHWELGEIQRMGALPKTLLVLPPLAATALRARWEVFAEMADSYELPPGLGPSADQHLVLAAAGPGRWRTWHSRRRTEWDYVAALRDAVRQADHQGSEP